MSDDKHAIGQMLLCFSIQRKVAFGEGRLERRLELDVAQCVVAEHFHREGLSVLA